MSTGTNQAQLLLMLKDELGLRHDTTGSDTELGGLLSNRQRWLADEYDWPFLKTHFDLSPPVGTRYLSVPNLNYQRPLVEVARKWDTTWEPLDYGIGTQEYNYLDSDVGLGQDPIQRWDVAAQIEVTPPVTAPSGFTVQSPSSTPLPGTYQYAYTFVSAFGETTISPAGSITTTSNQGNIACTIPVSTQSATVEGQAWVLVTGRNVYRTTAGGSVFYYLASINDNTTTTLPQDTVLDTALVKNAQYTGISTAAATVFEIWPLPQTVQIVRFTGQRLLSQLVNPTDTAELDDLLIVLFTAAQYKANRKHADAGLKMQEAQARLARVKQTGLERSGYTVIGGGRGELPKCLVSVRIGVAGGGH